MKLGFGIYYHMLSEKNIDANLSFAKQCGASHVIVHLVDYFHQSTHSIHNDDQPVGNEDGWGVAGSNAHVWDFDYLQWVKRTIEKHGLVWYGVENFDPADWYAILLGLSERTHQIEKLKTIIRNVGAVGVQCMGYNFSLAGVSSRSTGAYARGGAMSVGMDGVPAMKAIPQGMIWNMVYDEELYRKAKAERLFHPQCTHEELWQRLTWFLEQLVPVAEEAGVMLCAHPDDPPLAWVREQARLVYKPEMYQRLLDIKKSPSNGLEACLGTLQEMQADDSSEDVISVLQQYIQQRRVGYIHLRNVKGTVPYYKEVFIDEGDLDVRRVIDVLREHDFQGVVIPDHTPQMSCKAPWYAGMAFAMGYLKALL